MGIVYSGNFKKLLGLFHPSPVNGNVTTMLTPAPNTSWVGQAQGGSLATSNGFAAAGWVNNYRTGAPIAFDGGLNIYQLDAEGTINNLADTIIPSVGHPGTSRWAPSSMAWSANGTYLAVLWSCGSNSNSSGVYVYQKTATGFNEIYTIQLVSSSADFGGKIIWHSNNTTVAFVSSAQIYVADMVGAGSYSVSLPTTPIAASGAWLGNDLVYAYYDSSTGHPIKWNVLTKSNTTSTMTSTKTGLTLGSNMSFITGAIAVGSNRLIVTNASVTGYTNGLMVYDFSYSSGGNFTAKAGPSVAANTYAQAYVTYSSVSKRLILGGSAETRIFNDATGTLTSVSSGKISATLNVVAATHDDVSGNLIVMGDYDITTFVIPSSGYATVPSKQSTQSTTFAWNFNNPPIGNGLVTATTMTPTIATNFDTQTAVINGSPTIAVAPGQIGKYAIKFNNAGTDSVCWPKARDFQFMYSAFTLEFYLYNTGGAGFVIGDTKNFSFSLVNSSQATFRFYDGTITGITISSGWNHYAITYAAAASTPTTGQGTMKAYKNGQYAGVGLVSDINSNDSPFYPNNLQWGYLSMGASVNYADATLPTPSYNRTGFTGYLHNVAISNYVKYSPVGTTFTPPAF